MVGDSLNVRSEIEQAPHSSNDGRQRSDVGEADADTEALSIRQMSDLDTSHPAIYLDCAQVAVAVHELDARNCAGPQEVENRVPVIRRTITKSERDIFLFRLCGVLSAQSTRRTLEEILEGFIESPQAAESSRHRDFGHWHPGLMDELFGKKHSPCLCYGDGRGSQVLKEQAPQLTFTQAQAISELVNARSVAVESAFSDKRQGARDCIRSSTP